MPGTERSGVRGVADRERRLRQGLWRARLGAGVIEYMLALINAWWCYHDGPAHPGPGDRRRRPRDLGVTLDPEPTLIGATLYVARYPLPPPSIRAHGPSTAKEWGRWPIDRLIPLQRGRCSASTTKERGRCHIDHLRARGVGRRSRGERGSGFSQASMAASRRVRTELGGGAEDRHAGEVGQLARSELVHIAGDLVLLNQAPAEQKRIIGPERDRHASLEQVRTGTDAASGATPSPTLDDGQTSRVTSAAASRLTTSGSSTARTPCPIRSARSRSSVAVTLAAPSSSPACGTSSRPARPAMPNARSKSSAGPRRSS